MGGCWEWGGGGRTDGGAERVDLGGEGVEFGCRVVDLRGRDLGAVLEEDRGGVGEGREAEEEEGGQLHGGGLRVLFWELLAMWLLACPGCFGGQVGGECPGYIHDLVDTILGVVLNQVRLRPFPGILRLTATSTWLVVNIIPSSQSAYSSGGSKIFNPFPPSPDRNSI